MINFFIHVHATPTKRTEISIPIVLYFFFLLFFFHLTYSRWTSHYHPACGHKGSSHLSPVHASQFFLSRCKFSTLTTRQPMVGFYLLTFPRFPLRKKEHKSYFGKNRTHDFRTSRCAAYLLDHSRSYIPPSGPTRSTPTSRTGSLQVECRIHYNLRSRRKRCFFGGRIRAT